jgi:hypothetical protein
MPPDAALARGNEHRIAVPQRHHGRDDAIAEEDALGFEVEVYPVAFLLNRAALRVDHHGERRSQPASLNGMRVPSSNTRLRPIKLNPAPPGARRDRKAREQPGAPGTEREGRAQDCGEEEAL